MSKLIFSLQAITFDPNRANQHGFGCLLSV